MKIVLGVVIATVALVANTSVFAQTFPNKPIRMLLPFAPGGPVDVVARLIQPKLQEVLGQPVIIENIEGRHV